MNLWIRSQDKLRLAKYNLIFINFSKQTEILANLGSVGDEERILLGEYQSKERCF